MKPDPKKETPLTKYLRALTKPALARLGKQVGCSSASVRSWRSGNAVPAPGPMTLKLAEATGYALTPHDIHPDVYPHPLDGMRGANVPEVRGPGRPRKVAEA